MDISAVRLPAALPPAPLKERDAARPKAYDPYVGIIQIRCAGLDDPADSQLAYAGSPFFPALNIPDFRPSVKTRDMASRLHPC